MNALQRHLDDLRPYFGSRRRLRRLAPLFEMLDGLLYSEGSVTASAPHVRSSNNMQRLDWLIVLASLPATITALWRLGSDAAPNGYDAANVLSAALRGTGQFLPVLLTALFVAIAWECLFANLRERRAGHGVFITAWLFALIAPAGLPIHQAALAMSFGFVFGRAVFGGAGRNIVSPSLLGFVFVIFTFPDSVAGPESLFMLHGAAAVDAALATACMAGGLLMIAGGAGSWRVMIGAASGLAVAAMAHAALAGDVSAVYGAALDGNFAPHGFAFAVVFLATDPASSPVTNAGRWAYGVLVGLLTPLIGLGDPSQVAPVIFAIFFANIFAPVFDYLVAEANVRRRLRRLRS